MNRDYSAFKKYYFVKCFENEEYRKQFNTGKNIHISSTQCFHNSKNNFQQDFEGGIYRQNKDCKGKFIVSKNEMTFDDAIYEYLAHKHETDAILVPTQKLKLFIHGYIMCFAIFNKNDIRFNCNGIIFNRNSDIVHEFYGFLNDFAKESGYVFFSVLDAYQFMSEFCPSMEDKGYYLSYGFVNYEEPSTVDRISAYQAGKIEDIIFTKDKSKFSQQKEYRIFVVKKDGSRPKCIEENIDISKSVVSEMTYLTLEYAKRIGCKQE